MAAKRTKAEANAGVRPDRTPRPIKVRDTPIEGGRALNRSSALDKAAAREAGVTRGRQMKESERHTVVGKGKATRKA